MDDYSARLASARARIIEVAPEDVDPTKAVVIDIREPHELAVGLLPQAVSVPMGTLVSRIGDLVADVDVPIVLYCAVGERSAIAAADLEDSGYSNVSSLAGGIKRWMGEGLPTTSETDLTEDERRRYARHIVMPQVGVSGQQRLLAARVLIVGAGGLGSPAALYLAAAGVGTIGLMDDDLVELSNLQRQVIHATPDEGTSKAQSGANRLAAINPDISVIPHELRLTSENALQIMADYDLVIDATDNFATRYLINDASMHLETIVVHGSIFRFEGQITVFKPHETACYRCVFPDPPPAGLAPSCAEAGVFGVLPGVVGTMQATEALKVILGIGEPLLGRLLTYDALDQSTHTVNLVRNKDCPACSGQPPDLREESQYC